MKRSFAVTITGFLMATGFIATGSAAQAARCPDAGCTKTVTSTAGPDITAQGTSTRVRVRVAATGNDRVNGDLVVVIRRQGSGKVRTKSARYRGTPTVVNTGKLFKKGKYKVIVKYFPGPTDPYKRSRGVKLLQVS